MLEMIAKIDQDWQGHAAGVTVDPSRRRPSDRDVAEAK
jgi:hypothetical protein